MKRGVLVVLFLLVFSIFIISFSNATDYSGPALSICECNCINSLTASGVTEAYQSQEFARCMATTCPIPAAGSDPTIQDKNKFGGVPLFVNGNVQCLAINNINDINVNNPLLLEDSSGYTRGYKYPTSQDADKSCYVGASGGINCIHTCPPPVPGMPILCYDQCLPIVNFNDKGYTTSDGKCALIADKYRLTGSGSNIQSYKDFNSGEGWQCWDPLADRVNNHASLKLLPDSSGNLVCDECTTLTNTCSQCGTGLFNVCDPDECTGLDPKCFPDPTGLFGVATACRASLTVCPNVCTNDADCTDGNVCNGVEFCNSAGSCQAGTAPTINDNNLCTTDVCDPSTGVSNTPIDTNDNDPCTSDLCNPVDGQISHTALAIDDQDICTDDVCLPSSTDPTQPEILHLPTAIDDNDACTVDTCDPVSGVISNEPINIDDGNLCTVDMCDPVTGVAHTAININDNDACTVDACNVQTGVITHTSSLNDNNACTVDACNPTTGAVTHTPLDNINDNDLCTTDYCNPTTGTIVHTPASIDDGISCTVDSCNPNTGLTSHVINNALCPDNGLYCDGTSVCSIAQGGCVNQPLIIVDSNSCTVDSCNEQTDTVNHILTPNGNTEICNNNIDDNCNGLIDENCNVRCGDGIAQYNGADGIPNNADDEVCDDGNTNNNDICTNLCLFNACGDGLVTSSPSAEDCDLGGLRSDGSSCVVGQHPSLGCLPKNNNLCYFCKNSKCGNGVVENPNAQGIAEECDDGNTINYDSCSNSCKKAVCGDGVVNGNDECDKGSKNGIAGSGCSSKCVVIPICGNGIREGNEQCDDGNTKNKDGCSEVCRLERDKIPNYCVQKCGEGNPACIDKCIADNIDCITQCSNAGSNRNGCITSCINSNKNNDKDKDKKDKNKITSRVIDASVNFLESFLPIIRSSKYTGNVVNEMNQTNSSY